MRLIDADALVDALMMYTWYDEDDRVHRKHYPIL